jgi:hypothetical protein
MQIGITFGISCSLNDEAASAFIRSKPLRFKFSERQVGQESNLQPAVLETERFSLSRTTSYGLRARFNRRGVVQQDSGQIGGQSIGLEDGIRSSTV